MSEGKEKFTPGPWVEGWNGGLTGPRCAFTLFLDSPDRRLSYRVVSGQEMRLVCIIPDGEHAAGNEGNDAALIAAAPDMYAALENALRDMDMIDEICTIAGVHKFTLMRADIAAALAKARGEEV
jgi:hypothetical protein